jgi:hypothetical protein
MLQQLSTFRALCDRAGRSNVARQAARTAAILTAAVCIATPADAGRMSLIAGAEWSEGDYGGPTDTTVFYEFVSARYTTAPWSFKATLPFLQVDGPASVVDDEVESFGASRSASGIGDVSLSATYTFAWKPERLYLDLIGRVRLPTGDEDEGLGSGETDFIAVASLTKDFESVTVFADVGRRFLGSSPTNPRRDGWLLSAGASVPISGTTEIGATIDWRESARAGGSDPLEVSANVRFDVAEDVRMNVYAFAGLSDGSPDGGVGVTLTWRAPIRD